MKSPTAMLGPVLLPSLDALSHAGSDSDPHDFDGSRWGCATAIAAHDAAWWPGTLPTARRIPTTPHAASRVAHLSRRLGHSNAKPADVADAVFLAPEHCEHVAAGQPDHLREPELQAHELIRAGALAGHA